MTTEARSTGVRLSASAADLPPAVAAALDQHAAGTPGLVDVDGAGWATLTWGRADDPSLLLVHGVTSNAGIWWRVAPALAAAARRVIAVDMPGHGQTAGWRGRHRFDETAADLAGFIRAAGLDRPDLAVVGHSWGAMVTAHLPGAGIRPASLVLLDPPALTLGRLRAQTEQPTELPYATLAGATATVRTTNPTWSDGDVEAKALSLTQFNPAAVLAVLLENGAWDGGMAALRRPEAAGIAAWLIRGEWASGGLIPDGKVPSMVRQLGGEHVITIEGAPHSPQRTHIEATVLAILRAVGAPKGR